MPKLPPNFVKPPASKKTLRPRPAPLVSRAPEAPRPPDAAQVAAPPQMHAVPPAPMRLVPPPADGDVLRVHLGPGQLSALEAACRARGVALDELVGGMVDDWLRAKAPEHANGAEGPLSSPRALAAAARARVTSLLQRAYDRLTRMQQQSRTVRRLTAWVPAPPR